MENTNIPKPAQFTRASEACLSDGTLVAVNQPRYEGAGVRIEPGTENLVPSPDDLTDHIDKGFGLTLYKDRAVYNRSGSVVLQKSRFIADGGPLNFWMEAYGNAASLQLNIYDKARGINIKQITFELTETPQRFETSVSSSTSGNELELRLWFYKGTTHINWMQLERKTHGTSKINGTRAPETLSVPGLPTVEGVVEFTVEITDRTKLQDGIRRLLTIRNAANTQNALSLYHRSDAAIYHLATTDDAGAVTGVNFADSLIPNGTRTLKFGITTSAVTLYCDGVEIARINNPALPRAWGRIYLGSSKAGTDHADTSFGEFRQSKSDGTLLGYWPLQSDLYPVSTPEQGTDYSQTDYSQYDFPPYLLQQFVDTDTQKIGITQNTFFQHLDRTSLDFFRDIWIDYAEGAQLDIWGIHLGLGRLDRDDETYRKLLKLKAWVAIGGGTPESIITAIRHLYNALIVNYTVPSPGNVLVQHDGLLGLFIYPNICLSDGSELVDHNGDNLVFAITDQDAERIIRNIAPAGVSLTIEKI